VLPDACLVVRRARVQAVAAFGAHGGPHFGARLEAEVRARAHLRTCGPLDDLGELRARAPVLEEEVVPVQRELGAAAADVVLAPLPARRREGLPGRPAGAGRAAPDRLPRRGGRRGGVAGGGEVGGGGFSPPPPPPRRGAGRRSRRARRSPPPSRP